jgi:hypothetical protein
LIPTAIHSRHIGRLLPSDFLIYIYVNHTYKVPCKFSITLLYKVPSDFLYKVPCKVSITLIYYKGILADICHIIARSTYIVHIVSIKVAAIGVPAPEGLISYLYRTYIVVPYIIWYQINLYGTRSIYMVPDQTGCDCRSSARISRVYERARPQRYHKTAVGVRACGPWCQNNFLPAAPPETTCFFPCYDWCIRLRIACAHAYAKCVYGILAYM